MILLFLLTLLFINISNTPQVWAVELKDSSTTQALIPIKTTLHVFGYTAPYSIVQATGIRVFAQTSSDRIGYFEIAQLPLSYETVDICLSTIDGLGRVGFPLCIKAPDENEPTDIGPLLLSPTISLSAGIIWERQQVSATGQTIPNSQVEISFFEATPDELVGKFVKEAYAFGLPLLTGKSDSRGYYSVNLPTVKSSQFRVFTKSFYYGLPSPKSHTLSFSVGWIIYYWLLYIFPKLMLILLVTVGMAYLVYREKKTRSIRIWAVYFNETRLIPFEIRTRLQLKRIWYNLRGLWK
ncbi:hypothetical protein HYW55_01005 [Candidatus Gottesmanbacteria bacterium]|nr:hypothetical protein [Candidatus Gottesmanbacteria bacterium]